MEGSISVHTALLSTGSFTNSYKIFGFGSLLQLVIIGTGGSLQLTDTLDGGGSFGSFGALLVLWLDCDLWRTLSNHNFSITLYGPLVFIVSI
jgi:hypothetical protein